MGLSITSARSSLSEEDEAEEVAAADDDPDGPSNVVGGRGHGTSPKEMVDDDEDKGEGLRCGGAGATVVVPALTSIAFHLAS